MTKAILLLFIATFRLPVTLYTHVRPTGRPAVTQKCPFFFRVMFFYAWGQNNEFETRSFTDGYPLLSAIYSCYFEILTRWFDLNHKKTWCGQKSGHFLRHFSVTDGRSAGRPDNIYRVTGNLKVANIYTSSHPTAHLFILRRLNRRRERKRILQNCGTGDQ